MSTCFIIIDMQNEFLTSNGMFKNGYIESKNIIDNIKYLKSKYDNFLWIWVKAIYGDDNIYNDNICNDRPHKQLFDNGSIICARDSELSNFHEDLLPLINNSPDMVLEKNYYSAFKKTNLHNILQSHNTKHIYLGGVRTQACVKATALDAFNLNYNIKIVKNIIGTNNVEESDEAIYELINNGISFIDINKI